MLIENNVVVDADDVLNENVAPPSELDGTIEADAVEDTMKSPTSAVPSPLLSRTVIVQTTLLLARAGFVLLQDKLEAVVGVLYTT